MMQRYLVMSLLTTTALGLIGQTTRLGFRPATILCTKSVIIAGSEKNISKRQQPLASTSFESFSSSSESNLDLDPLIVCGPSGVGKGTIIAKFMEEMNGDDHFDFTVSHTTRAPRDGEVDGIHYHFVPMEDMQRQISQGGFLEYAEVHGNMYGTSWSSLRDVQRSGKRCLLDIDVQGVQRLKALENPNIKPKYLFIAPPSLQVLEERLIGRGTESAESLARRTSNAKRELEYGMQGGNFHAIVVNESLEKACKDFALAVQYLYNL